MNPVPIGIAGEIYIGGAGLARGYLNRPDLTAEKFIANPFIFEKNELNDNEVIASEDYSNQVYLDHQEHLRLYRTGDLARYLPDGNIEFLGRMDEQVKIRGFRIELGEIESTLNVHGDVMQAIVVAREDEPGHKQLVAYVVAGDFTPSSTELREFLSEKLPDYMIPTFFVFIDKIPLTLNGKIDRKALPAPDLTIRQVGDAYVAPETDIEKELSSIWSEVLRIEDIGVHDNFFKLGGDSIISIQLVAKARQRGIHFTVKDIFDCLTIANLVLIAKAHENTLVIKPEQGLIKGDIPLTPIQHWFFKQNLVNCNYFNQTLLLQVHSSLDKSMLKKAFELPALVLYYE